jgi:hypothetical protein
MEIGDYNTCVYANRQSPFSNYIDKVTIDDGYNYLTVTIIR